MYVCIYVIILVVVVKGVFFVGRSGGGWFKGCIDSQGGMDSELLALFWLSLIVFTAWLSYLSARLQAAARELERSGGDADELAEAVELIQKALAAIWENMPTMDRISELVPQFHLNQQETAGSAFFDFVGKYFMDQNQPSNTPQDSRDSAGRYIGATQIEEKDNTTQGETYAESDSSA
jgi:hypothetical protein